MKTNRRFQFILSGLSVLCTLITGVLAEFYLAGTETKILSALPHTPLYFADIHGVSYTPIALIDPKANLPVFATTLDFDFGLIDSPTFRLLQSYYSSWWGGGDGGFSALRYDPQKQYYLSDFLHPQMQAVQAHSFTVQRQRAKLPFFVTGKESRVVEQEVMVTCNCWGFAYSVLYSAASQLAPNLRTLFLSAGDVDVAVDFFLSDEHSQLVQKTHIENRSNDPLLIEENIDGRNARLQPGDILLYWHQNRVSEGPFLDHVAVYIDRDLYFERAGSGDGVPFRLTDWKNLCKAWVPGVFNVEWRRFPLQPKRIPSPDLTFGLWADITRKQTPLVSEIRADVAMQLSLDLARDKTKNVIEGQTYVAIEQMKLQHVHVGARASAYELPSDAYRSETFELQLPANVYAYTHKNVRVIEQ
eukprot:GDKI01033305.1.p1 GENE.GDKI01033305.1~~GDKI01033305.1.p1  ORF type:complete len:438 (+),score=62.16 GDKI01033305.1:71-1315(+)